MFKKHEDVKQLFRQFRNLKTEDELRMSEALEKHGGKVMAVIDDTITNIDDVDIVLDLLSNSGIMHGRFEGFSPDMFWVGSYWLNYLKLRAYCIAYLEYLCKVKRMQHYKH